VRVAARATAATVADQTRIAAVPALSTDGGAIDGCRCAPETASAAIANQQSASATPATTSARRVRVAGRHRTGSVAAGPAVAEKAGVTTVSAAFAVDADAALAAVAQ
jgi:hypothetical protein